MGTVADSACFELQDQTIAAYSYVGYVEIGSGDDFARLRPDAAREYAQALLDAADHAEQWLDDGGTARRDSRADAALAAWQALTDGERATAIGALSWDNPQALLTAARTASGQRK